MKTSKIGVAVALLAGNQQMAQNSVDTIVAEYRRDATEPPVSPTRGRLSIALDPKGIDRYTRSIRVIASTPNAVEGQKPVRKWKLDRFLKNPVVLWAHNPTIMPIGVASEIDPENPEGLSMRIRFATEKVSEIAEQAWNGILEDIVKAVSVGFDMIGEDEAELAELSVVPIGLDEDAGTPSLNPAADKEPTDEERAVMVKHAAATMARHRARVRQERILLASGEALGEGGGEARGKKPEAANFDLADGEVLRMDVAPLRLDALEDTPSGGKKIKARFTRTGVLMYADPSMPGGWRRELRLPEDVFNADSLRTLDGAPVIDVKHHTGMVTPETWNKVALGHVHGVRQDGDFVAGEIHVNAAEGLTAVESGERRDISSGYKCRLEWTSGEWRGQRYDCIQRGHVYNHVALCPPNGGRAGADVGVRVDSNSPQWGVSHWDAEDKIMKLIRLDGREMEYGSKEHLDTIEGMHAKELEKLGSSHATTIASLEKGHKEKLDSVTAERDGALQTVETLRTDLKEKEKSKEGEDEKRAEEKKAERSARRHLERYAFRLLSRVKPDDEEDEDDEEEDDKKKPAFLKGKRSKEAKLDAWLDTATDRQIHERIIKSLPGGEKFDAKDQSDVYVKVRFDMLKDQIGETMGNGLADVTRQVHQHQERVDSFDGGGGESPLSVMEKARKARDAAANAAGKVATK